MVGWGRVIDLTQPHAATDRPTDPRSDRQTHRQTHAATDRQTDPRSEKGQQGLNDNPNFLRLMPLWSRAFLDEDPAPRRHFISGLNLSPTPRRKNAFML